MGKSKSPPASAGVIWGKTALHDKLLQLLKINITSLILLSSLFKSIVYNESYF